MQGVTFFCKLLQIVRFRKFIARRLHRGLTESSSVATDFPALAEHALTAGSLDEAVFFVWQANNFSASQEDTYRGWALGEARTDYAAICVTDHELIGDQISQASYSGFPNTSHPSAECYKRVFTAAAELIQSK